MGDSIRRGDNRVGTRPIIWPISPARPSTISHRLSIQARLLAAEAFSSQPTEVIADREQGPCLAPLQIGDFVGSRNDELVDPSSEQAQGPGNLPTQVRQDLTEDVRLSIVTEFFPGAWMIGDRRELGRRSFLSRRLIAVVRGDQETTI